MIEIDFGEKENCFYILDLYTAFVLEYTLKSLAYFRDEWCWVMDRMSEYLCVYYCKIVFEIFDFVGYFV